MRKRLLRLLVAQVTIQLPPVHCAEKVATLQAREPLPRQMQLDPSKPYLSFQSRLAIVALQMELTLPFSLRVRSNILRVDITQSMISSRDSTIQPGPLERELPQ